ncbi:MAG: hypothetical protein L0220_20675 [Acidobacteria bacterium]|nr:hypothetical protein [Acidobacteriota bacterium]
MKPILLILLTMVLSSSAMGQDSAFIEIFGGYSYMHSHPSENRGKVGLNGWHSNLSVNLIGFIELEADLSGHYGSINGGNVNLHTFMIGPRFGYHGERVNWYIHNLYGYSYLSGEGSVLTPLIRVPADSSFAFVPLGGGFEINLNKKLTYRVAQFDFICANWGVNGGRIHPRISTGVVFNIRK